MYSSVYPTNATIDKGLNLGYQPFKERYNLDGLVQDIKKHLGQSGGISSEEVDSGYLISLMKKYISDPSDWIEYFHNDTSKNYTRNAMENINHKANIVSPGHHGNADLRLNLLLTFCSFSSYGTPGKGLPSTTTQMPTAS